ncbi:enoyl-CoA hydratase-related protein [Aromatoleum toluclasticum]|uniref:enoyl-CoA hydratase-related protein n=1 Tax=Aromatoleum toluclasticum TaxID=92003 RepID=UPI000363933B|nr:enoyl-CoA hydratase-related protein [Aromatoleum toluclasticum]
MDQNIRIELDRDGVLLACIDMPGRSMNVFSMDMMDSLERLVIHVEEHPEVRAVVLTSGKSAFIAGADLAMISNVFDKRARSDSHAQLVELCGRLGRIFRRLEKSRKPYVAALNGLALGGGLELGLACHARVVADAPNVLLGLPEIKLGLLPGAGGTQRLPRLVGARLGLRMLLDGNPLTPAAALGCALVDEVVPPAELIAAARRRALLSLERTTPPWDRADAHFDAGGFDFSAPDVSEHIARAFGLSEETLAKYPAYTAIMNCVVEGWNMPMDAALANEMDIFVNLIRNPVAGHMVRALFLNRQRSLKAAPIALDPRKAQVAVIGEGAEALTRRLAAGRAKVVVPEELGAQDVAVRLNGARPVRGVEVAWLSDGVATLDNARAGVWAAPKTEYGRAVEVVVDNSDDPAARDAALAVVRWLGADAVLVTRGQTSSLESMSQVREAARAAGCSEEEQLLAVSLAAIRRWLDRAIDDMELADAAAVVAGIAPAYSGGPFCCALQHGPDALQAWAKMARTRDAALFAWPTGGESLFAAAAA